MKDFNYTVNVLVKAYLNNTLRHTDCAACAVGNMIADSISAKPIRAREELGYNCDMKLWFRDGKTIEPLWMNVFCCSDGLTQEKNPEKYRGYAKKQIDSTGYSWKELARIEKAFELCDFSVDEDKWMFNGLMAVVDVLADIHKIDLKLKEEAKLLFVKS